MQQECKWDLSLWISKQYRRLAFKTMYVQFCNGAKSCAYWLVNETLWYETESFDFQSKTRSRLRPSHVSTRPRRERDVWKLRLETETTSLTSCVQISWNLPDRKSAKLCVIYLTKKNTKFRLTLPLLVLRESRSKSVRASSRQYTWSAQISAESIRFLRSYSRTREHHWNAPQSVSNTRRSFFAE